MSGSRVRLGRQLVSIHRRRDVRTVDSEAQAHQLIEALCEQLGRRAIDDLLRQLDGSASFDDESPMRTLVQRLLDGTIVVVALDHEPRLLDAPRSTPISELIMDGPGGEEPSRPDPVQDSTFVAFRLLDDDGTPIPGQPFVLTLPDGRAINGLTDATGRFEYGPVHTPGTCSVRFVTLTE